MSPNISLEPVVELTHNNGLSERQLRSVIALVEAHEDECAVLGQDTPD
jgi:hypothetical protein